MSLNIQAIFSLSKRSLHRLAAAEVINTRNLCSKIKLEEQKSFLHHDSSSDCCRISQFYKDKTIFITGATGFMGKVLVEKLLRSTNVDSILILTRGKNGMGIEQRLQSFKNSPIFEKIKNIDANLLGKVKGIEGDINEEDFGLHEKSKKYLIENVNIIFHSAASIKFNDNLTQAVKTNTQAVQTIISLAKQIKNLDSYINVSTNGIGFERN